MSRKKTSEELEELAKKREEQAKKLREQAALKRKKEQDKSDKELLSAVKDYMKSFPIGAETKPEDYATYFRNKTKKMHEKHPELIPDFLREKAEKASAVDENHGSETTEPVPEGTAENDVPFWTGNEGEVDL